MKQRKVCDLSEERPQYQTSREKIVYFRRISDHNLWPNSFKLQKVKRSDINVLKFSSEKVQLESSTFNKIEKAIRGDNQIQRLCLNLRSPSSREITDKDLLYISKNLKQLKSLKSFALKAKCSKITETVFGSFMKELGKLSSLEDLSLTLYSSNEGIEMNLNRTCQSLKKLRCLKDVCLDFKGFRHQMDQGFQGFNGIFNRLARIEKISVIFPCYPSQMTDEELQNMQFKRLVSLQEIEIWFGPCSQITDKGLYFLTQGLTGLANLQRIDLSLFGSNEFGNLGLHYLWEMMKSLPALEKISLFFHQCPKITDAGFYDMHQTLRCLPFLREFHSEFYRCPNISDTGLIDVCRTLKRFETLQKVELLFGGCRQITDKGFKSMIDCMKSLPNLASLGLDFFECDQLTETILDYMIEYLKITQSLREVILFALYECPLITEKRTQKFEDELEEIGKQKPNLDITGRDS